MQTLKSDIRNRILSAAKEQFMQRGYLKTSMREIADAVDVGVGISITILRIKMSCFV